jgi:hypothetical protein
VGLLQPFDALRVARSFQGSGRTVGFFGANAARCFHLPRGDLGEQPNVRSAASGPNAFSISSGCLNICQKCFEYGRRRRLADEAGKRPGSNSEPSQMITTVKRRLLQLGRVSSRTQAIWVGTLDEFTGSLLRYP